MAEFKEFEDGEKTERFAAEQPDAYMRRRDFLGRTAALAGLAGVAAATLPTETLVSQAARLAARTPLPTPSQLQGKLDTVVVLMMENRSFDHYLGWFPGADAKNVGLSYPDDANQLHPTHSLAPDFQGCAYEDPSHSWTGGRAEYNNGALDGFYKVNDNFAIGYYNEADVPFLPAAAKAFTLYDRYFTSILTGTYPNRHYQWSAQSGGQISNIIPADPSLGDRWENIFDRAVSQGVSVRYYASDLPFALLYGTRALNWIRPMAEFYADAAAGQLPNICFVDPPFTDGGGGDGLSADEHPHGHIHLGQAFMSEVVRSFVSSPQFRTGAMFVNYDEWGGFFDHVSPRFVPDDRESSNLNQNFGITGFRIPGVAISPYARRGHVSHQTITHESILKLISYRFGLGYLNKRHRYASNIGRSFDWANPNFTPPALPIVLPPLATPCTLQNVVGAPQNVVGGLIAPQAAKQQAAKKESAESGEGPDLNSPELKNYIESTGYDIPKLTAASVFHTPAVIRRVTKIWGK